MKIALIVLYFLLHSRKITSCEIIIYKILKLYNKINFRKIKIYIKRFFQYLFERKNIPCYSIFPCFSKKKKHISLHMLYKLNTTHKRDSTQRNDHQLLVKILLKKKKRKKKALFHVFVTSLSNTRPITRPNIRFNECNLRWRTMAKGIVRVMSIFLLQVVGAIPRVSSKLACCEEDGHVP